MTRYEPSLDLPGFEQAVVPWGSLKLLDFNLVRRLDLRTIERHGVRPQDLHICLEHASLRPRLWLNVRFIGVTQVVIDGSSQFFLGIRDVSSRGWEDVFYEVRDLEAGGIRFLCRDIELETFAVRASSDKE